MAQDQRAEHRPEEEREAALGPMVSRDELRPIVEDPAERLKLAAFRTVFPEGMVTEGIKAVTDKQAEKVVFRRITGGETPESPQTIFEAEVYLGNGGNNTYEVTLVGEPWKDVVETVDEGSILRANYKGRFRRRPVNATPDEKPLASEGDVIMPGGTIGLVKFGKGPYAEYSLPRDKFPKGGRIKKFAIEDEETVEPEKIIAFIEQINE